MRKVDHWICDNIKQFLAYWTFNNGTAIMFFNEYIDCKEVSYNNYG